MAVADQGRPLASWELQGSTGTIVDQYPDSPQTSGFWVFSIWYFPKFDKTYNQLSLEEREELADHWIRLRRLVQSFFHCHLGLA